MTRMQLAVAAAAASACAAASDLFCDVDDLRPAIMRAYGVRNARALDERTVKVVIGASTSPARGSAAAWRIVSEDDPDYAYEKFVKPTEAKASHESPEFEFPGGALPPAPADVALTRCEVTLALPFPLKNGAHYAAIGQGDGAALVTAAACAAEFTLASPTQADCDADRFAARAAGLRRVSSVGDGKLVCEFGHGYVPSEGLHLARWNVSVNGRRLPVKAIGRRTKLECYRPVGWPYKTLLQHDVFLDVGRELAPGDKVAVSVDESVSAGAREAGFTFDPAKSLSRSLKANQVGYLPDSPKVAYLGCWMGSMPDAGARHGSDVAAAEVSAADYYSTAAARPEAGGNGEYGRLAANALRFATPPVFSLLSWPDGKSVFSGRAVLSHRGGERDGKCENSAENVYTLDFTSFAEKGRYVLSVPGVGRSLPFDISPDVYERAFRAQAQGVYSQRCGIALDPKLTGGWRRVSCHDGGIAVTTERRHLCKEWGKFVENCEMVDNPAFARTSDVRAKVLASAAWRSGGEHKTEAGKGGFALERSFGVSPGSGATLVFEVRRDDSFAGGNWGGPLARFGGPKEGASVDVNWGMLSFGGASLRRINDGAWHRGALRVLPAEENGLSRVEFVFDGTAVGPEKKVYRDFSKAEGTVGVGYSSGPGAEGTFFRNVALFARALGDDELDALASSVPERIPRRIDARGGHHDAGDYNPRSHLDVAQTLMNAFELKPENFHDSQLNVPERGNGIPDILDEALWALRLWEGLQDSDGGVRNGTESQGDPNFVQTVELDDKGDYAWAKDAKGSFLAAGAFAQASRILARLGRAGDSARLLGRARRAYAWGVDNPVKDAKGTAQYGEYNIAPRAYAAAHLYHTTGEAAYHDDFRAYSPWGGDPGSDLSSWGRFDATLAAYAYALVPEEKADAGLRAAVVAAIRREADMCIAGSDKMAYKFIRNPYAPITWGTGAYENFAVSSAFAWRLTGEGKYRDWLVRTCDNTLGANPLGLSWITGLGARTIRCPLHNSRYRAAGFPVDGLQGQGPNQRGAGYNYCATAFPRHVDDYAPLQEFADVHFAIAMDEPTVNSMANTMFVFGLLCR